MKVAPFAFRAALDTHTANKAPTKTTQTWKINFAIGQKIASQIFRSPDDRLRIEMLLIDGH